MSLLSPYDTLLVVTVMAYGIALLGLNLLFGQAGLLSFGHALFLALGAYTAAVCTSRWGVFDMEVILAVSAAAAVAVALPVGALCVRSVRIQFGMLTLAFGMLFWSFLLRFSALTGGDQGLPVGQPRLLGREWSSGDNLGFLTGPYFVYVAGVLVVAALLIYRLVRSPFGLALRAARDHPLKASSIGIGVTGVRLTAFVVSGVLGAAGGALLAPVSGLADPTLAYWTQSGFLVFMIVLGGFRRFLGPLAGAIAFVFLQDRVQAAVDAWRFVFGAMLVVLVIVAPEGLAGLAGRLRSALARQARVGEETVTS